MNKLTYKQILSDYEVYEEGDFFRHYKLGIGSFIIYSPSRDKLSCIELCNFTDITAEDLGILLDKPIFMRSDVDEFTFEVCTDKEKILQYLFDIGFIDNNTNYFTYQVQPGEGYLLNCISANKKSKSINLIHSREDRVEVRFDNLTAYLDNGNSESGNLYITFDPDKFNSLINDAIINGDFYIMLLASANNILFDKVYEYGKNTSVVSGKENPLLILKLYEYYMNKHEPAFMSIDYDYSQVHVGFNKDIFSVTDVMNLMNKCIEDIRSEYGSQIGTFFDIKASGTNTYISFRKSKPLLVSFNRKFRDTFKTKLSINTIL